MDIKAIVERIDHDEVKKIQEKIVKESHASANLLPFMSNDEFSGLVLSILSNGFSKQDPIRRIEGKIWDGRNREAAVRYINQVEEAQARLENRPASYIVAKYEDKTKDQLSEADILQIVTQDNFHRRNLSASQRAGYVVRTGYLAGILMRRKNITEGEREKSEIASQIDIMKDAAGATATNRQYLYQCLRLEKEGRIDLLDKIVMGEITIPEAISVLTASPSKGGGTRKRQEGPGRPKAEVESQENSEPTEENKIVDALGNEVVGPMTEIFAILPEIDGMVSDIRKIRERFKGLILAPGGSVMNDNSREIINQLRSFQASIKESAPHSTCPTCGGEKKVQNGKKKVSCGTCNGKGWLTVVGFKTYKQFGDMNQETPVEGGVSTESESKEEAAV